ncbi:MAG: response regulator transcription factor [Sphingobacteriia bacterium]|jgi:DNA-binding NarL/FixJ family response regulator
MKKIVLVDDHVLLRNGLSGIIGSFPDYTILFEADNGKDFIRQLDADNLPDLVLLDVSMPEMNGYETANWLLNNYPNINILVLSMFNDERSIIKMLQYGAKGYILKDIKPIELKQALDTVYESRMYFNELLYGNLVHNIKNGVCEPEDHYQKLISLPEREKEFLKWVCTEKTLKEIAAEMCLSPRTIDGYRDNLFEKLNVTSRVGLVLFALRTEVVKL